MNFLEKFRGIDTFIFDVDGVLTNNEILVLNSGELLRTMNIRDGFAIKRAVQEGYQVAIITGGNSVGVQKRLEGLGVKDIFLGISDKKTTFLRFLQERKIDAAGVLYMGDDLPDYEVMRMVGLPACPNDAAVEITEVAQYISPIKGGQGCVRDVIEKVLRLHGRWNTQKDLISEDTPLQPDSF